MISGDGENLVFLLSLPRSGSTLLSLILGNHPGICCPPEPWFLLKLAQLNKAGYMAAPFDDELATTGATEFLPEPVFSEAMRAFSLAAYNHHLHNAGKVLFVDKTPRYYHILPLIDRLFPKARKIWLKRNPLDIAVSYREAWNVGHEVLLGKDVNPFSFDFAVGLFELAAYFDNLSPDRLEIQYEALAQNPRQTLASLCSWLEVPLEPATLQYTTNEDLMARHRLATMGDKKALADAAIHGHAIGRWHGAFTTPELQAFVDLLGFDIFRRLGYGETIASLQALAVRPPSETEASTLRKEIGHKRVDWVAQLRGQLNKSEGDRVAQLRLIDRLQGQLSDSESYRGALLEAVAVLQREVHAGKQGSQSVREELEIVREDLSASQQALQVLQKQFSASETDRVTQVQAIQHLREQLSKSESDRISQGFLNEKLEERIALLSTTEGALARLMAILSRKLRLYPLLKRHERALRSIYRTMHKMFRSPCRLQQAGWAADSMRSGAGDTTAGEDVRMLINSALVGAFAGARALEGNMDEGLLVDLYGLGRKLRHVLCLQPRDSDIQALYMLAGAGAKVTCVDCRTRHGELQTYGFAISPARLAEWLQAASPTTLEGIDALWLDGRQVEPEALTLLKGRLSPQARLLLSGPVPAGLSGQPAERLTSGLTVYALPPEWGAAYSKDEQL